MSIDVEPASTPTRKTIFLKLKTDQIIQSIYTQNSLSRMFFDPLFNDQNFFLIKSHFLVFGGQIIFGAIPDGTQNRRVQTFL